MVAGGDSARMALLVEKDEPPIDSAAVSASISTSWSEVVCSPVFDHSGAYLPFPPGRVNISKETAVNQTLSLERHFFVTVDRFVVSSASADDAKK